MPMNEGLNCDLYLCLADRLVITAPLNDVVCSCDYAIRVHSVAFLRSDVLVVCCSRDGIVVHVVFRSVAYHSIHVLVSYAHRNDVLVLCDILVCGYDIPVSCYNLHDAMVVCSDHSCDGWVSPHDVMVDNMVCVPHNVAVDS